MEIKDKLLDATLRVYAETGYRGATTRRIAHEAGVNEVTLFRQFGSKDALIQQALACAAGHGALVALPSEPSDPGPELTVWCRSRYDHLFSIRSLIRKVMGELEEHPEIIQCASTCPIDSASELSRYLLRLRDRGIATADFNPQSAAGLLMGALFADAMGRDVMPRIYSQDVEDTIGQYVRLLLNGIGVDVETPIAARPYDGHG